MKIHFRPVDLFIPNYIVLNISSGILKMFGEFCKTKSITEIALLQSIFKDVH